MITQKDLILEYVKTFGGIVPAKMGGKIFMGKMFGSEASRTCRKLRQDGLLSSRKEGRFEYFY